MVSGKHRSRWTFVIGAVTGGLVVWLVSAAHWGVQPVRAQATAQPDAAGADALRAELDVIQGKLPDQSHAMADVGYHFTNLWFAGQQENWPLADFCFKETKSHLNWAVRIIPVRKDNAGKEIDLKAILQALENSPLKQVEDAIAAKDRPAFESAYKLTLEGCYACHKASDKPYLHPQVPTSPAATIVNFDPKAEWPR